MKKYLRIFLKGIFMGAADIIPGVSGGTIALITGIYEKLILTINSILTTIILGLKSVVNRKYYSDFKDSLKKTDMKFFVVLALGISLSFLTISRFILGMIQDFPAYVFAFFFGLILASAVVIYKNIKALKTSLIFTGLAGFIISLAVVSLESLGASHSIPVIFGSGIAAACAMLLPGISGSFVLLLLGQYEFMLSCLKNIETAAIITFIGGMIVGGFVISRIISYFIKKYEQQTISFLIGLMVGGLALPIKNVVGVSPIFWNPVTVATTLISGIIGIVLVFSVEKLR